MNKGFWFDRRVLVTGHTGFKGSWLCLWLKALGAKVCGYALKPATEPNIFNLCNVAEDMVSIFGDVRDFEAMTGVLSEFQPEIVIHMAAQPLVRASYARPLETIEINVMGTANVLEASRNINSVRVVLVVTTDKCYENKAWPWGYREIDTLGGYDPYSSSKACAELVVASYRQSFYSSHNSKIREVAVATVRAGNVIGGGDWSQDRLVPDTVRAMQEGRTVVIRYPGAIRPWQHVLDPLHGYLMLSERLWSEGSKFCEAWNFGPTDSNAKTVSWLVNRLTKLFDDGASWVADQSEQLHETSYLKLDSAKAITRLGWRSVLGIDVCLEWIVYWYQAQARGDDMSEITRGQIKQFERMAEAIKAEEVNDVDAGIYAE